MGDGRSMVQRAVELFAPPPGFAPETAQPTRCRGQSSGRSSTPRSRTSRSCRNARPPGGRCGRGSMASNSSARASTCGAMPLSWPAATAAAYAPPVEGVRRHQSQWRLADCFSFTRRAVVLIFSERYERTDEAVAAERRLKRMVASQKEAYVRQRLGTAVATRQATGQQRPNEGERLQPAASLGCARPRRRRRTRVVDGRSRSP